MKIFTERVSSKNWEDKWGWICQLTGKGHCRPREAPNMLVSSLMEMMLGCSALKKTCKYPFAKLQLEDIAIGILTGGFDSCIRDEKTRSEKWKQISHRRRAALLEVGSIQQTDGCMC